MYVILGVRLTIGVFVSGNGSTLQSMLQSERLVKFAKIVAVVSDRSDCMAVSRSVKLGIPTYTIKKQYNYEDAIQFLKQNNVNLVCLAGFLKKIPQKFISRFHHRILNLHPSLLPSYGGKGMYGRRVHRAVLKNKEKTSGCTVHFVNNEYDQGEILLQKSIQITPLETEEILEKKILQLGYEIYIDAIIQYYESIYQKSL